jgi:hypothetical protein
MKSNTIKEKTHFLNPELSVSVQVPSVLVPCGSKVVKSTVIVKSVLQVELSE